MRRVVDLWPRNEGGYECMLTSGGWACVWVTERWVDVRLATPGDVPMRPAMARMISAFWCDDRLLPVQYDSGVYEEWPVLISYARVPAATLDF